MSGIYWDSEHGQAKMVSYKSTGGNGKPTRIDITLEVSDSWELGLILNQLEKLFAEQRGGKPPPRQSRPRRKSRGEMRDDRAR